MVAVEIGAGVLLASQNKRRAARYKLDVPIRVILQKLTTTLIRDGRGTELSEYGMCIMVGVELGVGEEVEIEFTFPYSGEPIRVSSVVHNRVGYRYGCELIPEGQGEEQVAVRLRQVLQTFAGERFS